MKKKIFSAVVFALVAAVASFCVLTGCDKSGDSEKLGAPDAEYVIAYTDDSGPHQITVKGGMPYSIETLPTREGYVFTGLYDAEIGGTQYVSASGASLSPFTDRKNIVLFPQFKAKEYTVILDYRGAPVIGDRQITVEYNTSLPELPKMLQLDHKIFKGWFTEKDCGGVCVADEYGLVPVTSVLNGDNFDLTAEHIYLYAGFEWEKLDVTCYFGSGYNEEIVQADWGSYVKDIVTKTRVNGNAVLRWSKTDGGEEYTGVVEDGMTLHALEFAPAIDFDANGGKAVKPIVQRAGTTLELPVTTRSAYKFSHWEDTSGAKFESTTMPSKSVTLKAVWNAMIVFDENGGSEVDDISVSTGSKITLPTTEKDGYIFAGWYTADKTQYTSTTMPATGVKLKAGWYKGKTKVYGSGTKEGNSSYLNAGGVDNQSADWRQEWDLSEIIPSTGAHIHIKYINTVRLQVGNGGKIVLRQYYYDTNIIGESYLLGYCGTEVNTTSKKEITFETDLVMKSDTLYVAWYAKNIGTANDRVYFNRVSLEITYPDTTTLYL